MTATNDARTALNVRERIESAFIPALQQLIDAHFAANLSPLQSPEITVEYGQTYAKIIRSDRPAGTGGRSVHAFIALGAVNTKNITAQPGDILKPANWKAPAKHARGNVFNAYPIQGVGVYGCEYRR